MQRALFRWTFLLILCVVVTGVAYAQTEARTEEDTGETLTFSLQPQGDDGLGGHHFVIRPSAAQEIPPTTSDASGIVTLRFNGDLSRARYNLTVFNATGVTQAHLHCGSAGVAGPIVVFLFGLIPEGVDANGSLISGEFSNADILPQDPPVEACGVVINNLASLLSAIRDGRVYVNIHTLANPPGELRGQIFDQ